MINWLYIVFLLVILWTMAIMYLAPRISRSKHFGLLGPALMVKSTKNRNIIDRIAKRFPGILFGKISVVLVIISSIFAVILLVYGSILSLSIKPSNAPSLSLLIGLPGINPAIPISYGVVTIIAAVAIHEIFHGVVARRQGIKLSSVGALFFIIPLGAFVEPDEKEITSADPVIRRRVIAAGPGINIVIAIISLIIVTFLLFPAVTPTHQGLYVESTTGGSAAAAFIPTGTELISYGNSTLNYSGNALLNMTMDSVLIPGHNYTAEISKGGTLSKVSVPAGIVIASVIEGLPAYNASVPVGSIILSVDGNVAYNDSVLSSYLDGVAPGSKVNMSVDIYNTTTHTYTIKTYAITTTSLYYYYSKYDPSSNSQSYMNKSFVGITLGYLGIGGLTLSGMQAILSGSQVFTVPWNGILEFISLPFAYLYPVPSSLASLFTTPFSPLVFWGVVNVFYWLFWWDLLLAITNALPLFVFDGGQFFRDTLYIAGKKERLKFLRSDANVRKITTFVGFLVLFLFLWEIIVPRIV